MDRWIKEAIYIRKEQNKSMNRDEGSYQLSHINDKLFTVATSSGERKLTIIPKKATAAVAETSANRVF